MLHKTSGIVLNYIKYKDSSVIARIYTDQFGVQSYIVNSVRSKKSKNGLALLQPLTLLDMVVYHKSEKPDSLQRISQYSTSSNLSSIPFEIKKSSMALFVTELLSRVLQQEEHHGSVFDFLYQFILKLDQMKDKYESLHLYLMVQLTHYIGFGIHNKNELISGNTPMSGTTDFDHIYNTVLHLNQSSLENVVTLDNVTRKNTLRYMMNYYVHHMDDFKELKSLEVLSQVFH